MIWLAGHPRLAGRVLKKTLEKLPNMVKDLGASRFKFRKLSFVIHDFMDDCALDPERIETCVFKNMTGEGPLSMCLCNAKRDNYLLRPILSGDGEKRRFWHPLDGHLYTEKPGEIEFDARRQPVKRLKGRARRTVLDIRTRRGTSTSPTR